MSDYFFARENSPMPMFEVSEEFEEAVYSTRFTFPSKPIPVLAKYRPEEDYEITSIILEPEFSISKVTYNSIDMNNIYGVNWIPIKVIDKGEHDFMMLQLAHEIDIIDHDRSELKRVKRGNISGMRKLVIDVNKLLALPLYKRLIFRDQSWGFHIFYHKSIVDKIMSQNPTGIKFVPIENFNESWAG
ncbi:hypothetical protein [Vibrio japonicus]|uniref:Uncharacterized protein n=1 Tax=Vibrio japonicus TaxID=1824638 RepID=A0ABY5LK59_9VIBR|nr:hypothetical protein [Vibrio japonicus]UUM32473.1 hypothetical protein NP165_19580 [Vibrio japonicus]